MASPQFRAFWRPGLSFTKLLPWGAHCRWPWGQAQFHSFLGGSLLPSPQEPRPCSAQSASVLKGEGKAGFLLCFVSLNELNHGPNPWRTQEPVLYLHGVRNQGGMWGRKTKGSPPQEIHLKVHKTPIFLFGPTPLDGGAYCLLLHTHEDLQQQRGGAQPALPPTLQPLSKKFSPRGKHNSLVSSKGFMKNKNNYNILEEQ